MLLRAPAAAVLLQQLVQLVHCWAGDEVNRFSIIVN
jgi:hypothetical protein